MPTPTAQLPEQPPSDTMQEALSALGEALRMAQQNNDQWCLLHALALMCRMLGEVAPGEWVLVCVCTVCEGT